MTKRIEKMNKEKIFNLSKKRGERKNHNEKNHNRYNTQHTMAEINLNIQIIIYVNRLLIHTQSLSNFKNPF